MSQATIEATATTPKAIKPGRFDGMLGSIQTNAYGDMFRHGIAKPVAHKVAFDLGADIGHAMKQDKSDLSAKVSKANKEGARGFKVSGKLAAITASNAMGVLALVQHLESMFQEGLMEKRANFSDLSLVEPLEDYISRCEDWAKGQTFATE